MKNTTLLYVFGLLFLGGCICMDRAGDNWEDDCKSAREITLKVMTTGIVVSPSNICADPGEPLMLKIDSRRPVGVRTLAKDADKDSDKWLNQSNDNPGQIVFPVPGARALSSTCKDYEETGCKFYYAIKVDGVGELDPMITVRRF